MNPISRRQFLKNTGHLAGGAVAANLFLTSCEAASNVRVSGHLWIYASKFPPDWDSTPVLDRVFSDFQYAGIEGLELMEVNLRHADAVSNIGALIEKYNLPVTGTSYGADMWNKNEHEKVLEDVESVITNLHQLGGVNFGITVGDAGRLKTESELDAQAEILKKILKICEGKSVIANLHNHTFEVEDDLYDLKGTLARVPEIKLGPDLNWLIRGGVDPVEFIKTYGNKIVYMHIRDQNKEGVWTESVGEGVTDFSAIARALQEINYKGDVAIELASHVPPVKEMRENWKTSRAHVRKVFGW